MPQIKRYCRVMCVLLLVQAKELCKLPAITETPGFFLTCLEQELSRRKLNPTRNQKELCKLPAITETPVFF